MTDKAWIIRRLKGVAGTPLKYPIYWGRVTASSDTVAVLKFLNLSNTGENSMHFDAIPSR